MIASASDAATSSSSLAERLEDVSDLLTQTVTIHMRHVRCRTGHRHRLGRTNVQVHHCPPDVTDCRVVRSEPIDRSTAPSSTSRQSPLHLTAATFDCPLHAMLDGIEVHGEFVSSCFLAGTMAKEDPKHVAQPSIVVGVRGERSEHFVNPLPCVVECRRAEQQPTYRDRSPR